ncbi:hypothetical protein RJ639_021614 [Escallonia herrerae]|uniref:DUF1232 domain-containing protein n=1 Tax=Escallonia herrerae TaxID=1293975 RepID=A0AA89AHG5_9ASTE|nr:hypothetical protein RJ639_021614 [Escallonia herrerae]
MALVEPAARGEEERGYPTLQRVLNGKHDELFHPLCFRSRVRAAVYSIEQLIQALCLASGRFAFSSYAGPFDPKDLKDKETGMRLQDLPFLLRWLLREMLNPQRSLPLVVKAQLSTLHNKTVLSAIYLISPVDIIPEAIFGIIGLLDDLVIVLVCFLHVAALYRDIGAYRLQQSHEQPKANEQADGIVVVSDHRRYLSHSIEHWVKEEEIVEKKQNGLLLVRGQEKSVPSLLLSLLAYEFHSIKNYEAKNYMLNFYVINGCGVDNRRNAKDRFEIAALGGEAVDCRYTDG